MWREVGIGSLDEGFMACLRLLAEFGDFPGHRGAIVGGFLEPDGVLE